MIKKQITPKQTIYRLSYLSNDFSISKPFDTLADAKHEACQLISDKTASDIKITKYDWPAWKHGQPSPTPTHTIVWKINKQKGEKNDDISYI